jgi:hypothetical protein
VAAVGIAVAAIVMLTGGSPAAPVTYRIVTPPRPLRAGRSLTPPPSAFSAGDLQGSSLQKLAGGKLQKAVNAFYTDPATGATVIFNGGTGPLEIRRP